ncbi:15650_t:CDS:2 [Funneliformis mosseae]|uniref:15650_t:CDS:1 n=1 Tax=Funneliformis mosseae TaxID=27381 RepID=A0A9N9ABD8_FUNMO|nr:15650_t:CDS:2 [Funneliformis mosseae]
MSVLVDDNPASNIKSIACEMVPYSAIVQHLNLNVFGQQQTPENLIDNDMKSIQPNVTDNNPSPTSQQDNNN